MPIPKQYLMSVLELKDFIRSGHLEQARSRLTELFSQYQSMERSGTLTTADSLELLGSVAQTLKKAGQAEMALPWFQKLCDLSLRLVPESENTAWDFYHLAECLETLGRVHEAADALRQARTISRNDKLLEKIATKMSAIGLNQTGERKKVGFFKRLLRKT